MKILYTYWQGHCTKKGARKLRLSSVRAFHSKLHGSRSVQATALHEASGYMPIAVDCVRAWPEHMLERYSFLRCTKS